LSRVITGDDSWNYGYGPETKQQSCQCEKSKLTETEEKARQAKSKIKSMLIIFFDIKEIVHKELVLASQIVDSIYYCDILW
jgi:hypothetical protein